MNRRARMTRTIAAALLLIVGLSAVALAGLLDDVGTARDMLDEANQQGDALVEYGNWYGPGWWGGGRDAKTPGSKPPVDELDAIAMRHDFAYQLAEEWGAVYGEREAQRIRSMADAIAVQDASKLDPDPSKWNPPATDPTRADRYRDRIIFGFDYLSSGRAGASKVLNAADWATSPIQNWYSDYDENKISEETMTKLVDARVTKWNREHPPLPTFQLEMVKAQDVIAEGGSTTFEIRARPTSEDAPWLDSYKVRINLYIDGIPGKLGKLDKLSCELGETVTVTATKRFLNLSAEGYRISVTARSNNEEEGITILPVTGQFTIGKSSSMSVGASPSSFDVTMDSAAGCEDVNVEGSLSDGAGDPIEGATVHIELDESRVANAVTGSDGVFEAEVEICASDLSGAEQQTFTINAVYEGREQGSPIISGASASTTVTVNSLVPETYGGRVTNARTGDAISGVSITVKGPSDSDSTTSSAQGSFNFSITVPSDLTEQLDTPVTLTATKEGYESVTLTMTAFELNYDFTMQPQEIILTGTVYDKESGEALVGAFGNITEPFARSFGTGADGGFSIEGLYVGDRVTISCWAVNHQTYRKSGVITSTTPHLSFYLGVGEGEVDSGLEEEEQPEDEEVGVPSYGLTIWASPADPGAGQGVTVTALIHPIEAGVAIRLAIVGTDGYTNSVVTVTDATGRAYLYIPGAVAGVVDRVTVTLLDQALSRRLNYTF
jgi:hypothetical protein